MISKKFVAFLAGSALAMTAACSTSTPEAQPSEHLAADAAQMPYPSNAGVVQSTTMGAVYEPSSKVIQVLNFGDNGIHDGAIWVNGAYVYKVESLPPDGYVSLPLGNFYDHNGQSLTDSTITVTKVQLAAGDKLYNLLGPIVH